jgi:hypothetical protein
LFVAVEKEREVTKVVSNGIRKFDTIALYWIRRAFTEYFGHANNELKGGRSMK